MSALSDEFARLADAATPGPWEYEHDNDGEEFGQEMHPFDVVKFRDGEYEWEFQTEADDAKFIAFCGTHRAEIARALRIADVVLEPSDQNLSQIGSADYCIDDALESGTSIIAAIIAIADEGKP